ncbi:hypothetical protein [Streptomyces sp. NPDC005374]|uniref:hypothetical protein n=1 Tax=Streptomyces sp. NPDC005374 TaxID=3364713 RepID=UPI0036D1D107
MIGALRTLGVPYGIAATMGWDHRRTAKVFDHLLVERRSFGRSVEEAVHRVQLVGGRVARGVGEGESGLSFGDREVEEVRPGHVEDSACVAQQVAATFFPAGVSPWP